MLIKGEHTLNKRSGKMNVLAKIDYRTNSRSNRFISVSLVNVLSLFFFMVSSLPYEVKAANNTCASHPGWKTSLNKHTNKWICSYNKRASCPGGYVLIRKPTGVVRPWQCKRSRYTAAATCPANTSFNQLSGKCFGSRILKCGTTPHLATYYGMRPTESFGIAQVIKRTNYDKGYDITEPIAVCGSYGGPPKCLAGYKYQKRPGFRGSFSSDLVDRCTKRGSPFNYPTCKGSTHIFIESGRRDQCVANFHEAVW